MGTHTQDVTVVGWVGSDLRTYHLDGVGGVPYAQFRLASTRRVLDRQTGVFRDGPTLWFTVKAWRTIAVNLADSLRKSDPVVVVGRLGQSEWVAQDGSPRSELVLEALSVGHDLAYGSAQFRRTLSGTRRGRDDAQADGTQGDEAQGEGSGRAAYTDDPWAQVAGAPPGDEPEGDAPDPDGAGADGPVVDLARSTTVTQDGLALAGRG